MLRLTKNEESILRLLWDVNRPLTRGEIIELTPNRQWTPASVHSFLNHMLDKGVIEVAGFDRTGKRYGRTYQAAMTQEELAARQMCDNNGKPRSASVPAILAALLQDSSTDEQVLDELEALLKNKRQQLQDK